MFAYPGSPVVTTVTIGAGELVIGVCFAIYKPLCPFQGGSKI